MSMFDLLKEVLTSWQVIAVTLGLLIYIRIVIFASKATYRPPKIKKISFKRKKVQHEAAMGGPEMAESSDNTNDELGLEEA